MLVDGRAYRLLLEILCGLQSPMIGETQVVAQFKGFLAGLPQEHAWIRRTGQRLLADARQVRTAHLQGLGSRSYGSAVRRCIGPSETPVLIGTGKLAADILPYVAETGRTVHQWGRAPTFAEAMAGRPLVQTLPGVCYRTLESLDSFPGTDAPAVVVVAAPAPSSTIARVAAAYRGLTRVVDLRAEAEADPLVTPVRPWRRRACSHDHPPRPVCAHGRRQRVRADADRGRPRRDCRPQPSLRAARRGQAVRVGRPVRLRILSRSSDLARVQARLVGRALQARFPDVDLVYDTRASAGDRDTATPLASLPDKGVFTADLSSALASGAADLVVHSWKDLPLDLPSGHVIGATLERADPRDVLLVRRDVVAERPSKLRVLSSSPRRAWLLQDVLPALLPWRASVEMVEVRGNVPTRIAKLMEGLGDALAVAKAALDRLLEDGRDDCPERAPGGKSNGLRQQLDRCAWMVLPIKDVPTAPAQGALAVEISASNAVVRHRLEEISHRPTWDAVCQEREVLARHGGGCHQALGATILPRSYGTITSVRARSANGCVTTWSLTSEVPLPPRTSARYIWPRPDERPPSREALRRKRTTT